MLNTHRAAPLPPLENLLICVIKCVYVCRNLENGARSRSSPCCAVHWLCSFHRVQSSVLQSSVLMNTLLRPESERQKLLFALIRHTAVHLSVFLSVFVCVCTICMSLLKPVTEIPSLLHAAWSNRCARLHLAAPLTHAAWRSFYH